MTDTGEINWYLQQIGREPLLTASEEITLGNAVRAWLDHPDGPEHAPRNVQRIGKRAKDRFVRANLRLVVHVVNKLARHTTMEFMDLIQAGNLGIIRAVELFDPTRGYKFSTYAYWWIRQSVGHAIDRESHTIRLPTTYPKLWGQFMAATRALAAESEFKPSRAVIAQRMGVTLQRLEDLLAMALPCTSLDANAGGDDHSALGELIASPEDDGWVEQLHAIAQAETLRNAIALLPELEQRLITGHFGLDGGAMTVAALARQEHIPRKTVSQLLAAAQLQLSELLGAAAPAALPVLPEPSPAPECSNPRSCRQAMTIHRVKWRRVSPAPGQLALF